MKQGPWLLMGILMLSLITPQMIQDAEAARGRTDCMTVPEVHPSYEWAYELEDGTERFWEVIRSQPATSSYGTWNMTTIGFADYEGEDRVRWGRQTWYEQEGPYPGAKLSQDAWTEKNGTRIRTIDYWDQPMENPYIGPSTCPGRFEDFTSTHTRIVGGSAGSYQVNESWQVRAGHWENVSVPAGTFESLPVHAVRLNDCKRVTTWVSPEAKGVVQRISTVGLDRAPDTAQDCPSDLPVDEEMKLTWHILDRRPVPRFQLHPHDPIKGEDLILNGTPSFDYEGEIVRYRWVINGEERMGPNVTVRDLEEGTLRVRLFVTDEGDRTSTLGTSLFVPPEEGEGVAIEGPLAAQEGQYVHLEALTQFDPVRVRWKVNDTVVGDGPSYVFVMDRNTTLQVDAVHPSGRVFTTNHTVTLLDRSPDDDGQAGDEDARYSGSSRQGPSQWPSGGSSVLSLLDPLEGQVVRSPITAHVWTSGPAQLHVDGDEVWSGSGPEAFVDLELDPGRHSLNLTGEEGFHLVNITVSQAQATDDQATSGNRSTDAGEAIPGPGVAWLISVVLTVGWMARRRR